MRCGNEYEAIERISSLFNLLPSDLESEVMRFDKKTTGRIRPSNVGDYLKLPDGTLTKRIA